jgi:acyl-CoA synthetase (NDP forming)
MNPKKLLEPASIAIIGASPETLWTRNILFGLRRGGYRGEVWCVNPGRATVLGFPCFAAIDALPGSPDLAVVLLSSNRVPDTLRELARRGCGAAYVLAAGFEDADKLRALRALVNELGILLLGPNCNGFIRPDAGLHVWTGPIPRPYQAGSLAIVAQSSAVIASTITSAWDRALGFSAMIGTGNEANFTLTDALEYLADNADTRAILCYLEQFGDFRRFAKAVLRCRQNDKAVIVVATGRSQSSRQVTLSHTGAITAGPEIAKAALEALGVIQARDMDEALDAASLFVQLPRRAWRPIRNVGIVTISGGYGALAADTLADEGLALPALPPEVIEVLPEIVPKLNPMDLTATVYGWADGYPRIYDAFVKSDTFDAVIVLFGAWEGLERFNAPVAAWAYRVAKPVLLGGNEVMALSSTTRQLLELDPIPVIQGIRRIARALAAMNRHMSVPPRLTAEWGADAGRSWSGPQPAPFPDLAPALLEYQVKTVPWVEIGEGSGPASLPIEGPYVLKLESAELPHKSEHNAVRVNVSSAELAAVARQLRELARQLGLRKSKVIAQQMVAGRALELLIGAVVDPTVGPVLTVGLGGVTAELLNQRVHALCPLSAEQARELVAQLGIGPLFAGYRNQEAYDPNLFQLIADVSRWVYDHRGQLRELDLNPVLVRPGAGSTTIVDALAGFTPGGAS